MGMKPADWNEYTGQERVKGIIEDSSFSPKGLSESAISAAWVLRNGKHRDHAPKGWILLEKQSGDGTAERGGT
jgi:hypothetical protein